MSYTITVSELKIRWDAYDLAMGVYLYRLLAGDYVQTRKLIMMK